MSTHRLAATADPPIGRKGVLLTCIALAVGALVGITVLDMVPEPPKQGRLAIAQLAPDVEVLTVGASHVYTAVDPELTGRKWVNLSAGLMNYVFMEGVVEAHLAQLPKLQAVLLDFNPLPVFADSYGVANGDYRHLLDLEPSILGIDEPWQHKVVLMRDRLFMYQLPFRRAFMREKADFDVLHRLRSTDWSEIAPGHEKHKGRRTPVLNGAARVHGHWKNAYNGALIPHNLDAFARIVARVRAAGVPLVLVRFPVHSSYRDASPQAFFDVMAQLEQRAREISPAVPVLDYTREPAFGDDEYWDGDHLNQLGSQRLTPRLASDLRTLLQTPLAR